MSVKNSKNADRSTCYIDTYIRNIDFKGISISSIDIRVTCDINTYIKSTCISSVNIIDYSEIYF